MDVRCEKCQTEYELDEARLKPSGVTVKCTQCGHMFKIRKRAITNVGAPPASEQRSRPSSSKQPIGDATVVRAPSAAELSALENDSPTSIDRDRNWLIRLDNGEQRSCRELAALQQWIVAGAVTRESLISRTGKTWKRLGDIAELAQYFTVADEARTRRAPTNEPATKQIDLRSTMMGVGTAKPSSAGGTIVPDEDDPATTGSYRPTPPSMPPPPGARTPPMGVATKPPVTKPATKAPPIPAAAQKPKSTSINETLKPPSMNQTLAAVPPPPQLLASAAPAQPAPLHSAATVPIRTTPQAPGVPATPPAAYAETVPSPTVPAPPTLPRATPSPEGTMTGLPSLKGAPPAGNRATAAWATEAIKDVDGEGGGGPSGPIGGRLGAIPDERAFSGRVRAEPTDASVFGKMNVKTVFDEDEDMLPQRRGSRAGLILAVGSLLVIAGAVAVVYLYVLRDQTGAQRASSKDAAVAVATPDAATPVVTPLVDAAAAPPPADPLAAARGELAGDVEPRLRTALDGLAGKDDPASQAVRARLDLALAEDLADHANLVTDRGEADKLRRDSSNLVIDALPLAQHAIKGDPASAEASLAMADVMRLQNKPAGEVKRFADKARGALPRDAALVDALVLVRDHKLDAARDALAAIDQGDNRMEASGDVRARLHLALLALAADKPGDAKPLVDQILAAKPEHVVARALSAKLDTTVARTDPLPPEDHGEHGDHHPPTTNPPTGTHPTGTTPALPSPGDEASYDALMAQARKVADSNCSKAMELYQKALDIKPSSVEALTGEAYCHLDAKEFSQAYTLFHAALLYSSHYEPALEGVAELYQQQGNKDRAIEAWQAYLAAYPGSAKALKNLELLGATPAGGGGGSAAAPTPPPAGSAAPTPAAPAPAAPAPAAPAPAPADGSAN